MKSYSVTIHDQINVFSRTFTSDLVLLQMCLDLGFVSGLVEHSKERVSIQRRDALVSCSTSTPINHIVVFFFFAEYQLYYKTAGHLGAGGGRVRTPFTLPLDPPLIQSLKQL